MLTIINGVATKGKGCKGLPLKVGAETWAERERETDRGTVLSPWPSAVQCRAKHLTSGLPKILINYCVEKGAGACSKVKQLRNCCKSIININIVSRGLINYLYR